MAKAANYTPEERAQLDEKLERMTTEELNQLEAEGGKLIRQYDSDRQREYTKRYKRRIALAARITQSEGERR